MTPTSAPRRVLVLVEQAYEDLENAGARFLDQSVVVDGHLISSRTPADLPDFCRALIAALTAKVPA